MLRELQIERESYKLLVESVKDYAILMTDAEGYIVSWNKGAEKIKGYTANEIIGQHITRIVPNERVEIEHLSGHHFMLTIALQPHATGCEIHWRQSFDTIEHYAAIAQFVAQANQQNLQRLVAEVARGA